MTLSSSGAVWTETPGDGVSPAAVFGVIVSIGGGDYEFAASGVEAAGLVSDGVGGYDVTVGAVGTGKIIFVGASAVIL